MAASRLGTCSDRGLMKHSGQLPGSSTSALSTFRGNVTPAEWAGVPSSTPAVLDQDGWQQPCRGLFQVPIAAWLRIRHGHGR
jgi:hypothetical protein